MPRFFFDIHDGDHLTHDDEGQELESYEVARAEAQCVLPDVAKWVLPDGDERTLTSTVRDAMGKPVFQATLTLLCKRLD